MKYRTRIYYTEADKALQRTRISAGGFPWPLVRAAEPGRYAAKWNLRGVVPGNGS
jgi:hypothetical protein